MSQSLWNRAGSFDSLFRQRLRLEYRLNPFGTGRGLSTKWLDLHMPYLVGLNPFGTGRGLSTAGVVWCLDG